MLVTLGSLSKAPSTDRQSINELFARTITTTPSGYQFSIKDIPLFERFNEKGEFAEAEELDRRVGILV